MKKRTTKNYYTKEIKRELKRVRPKSENKHQAFYCTVCKMATWTFHKHMNGIENLNKSSTGRKVHTHQDISVITKT